jgi:hypothetical protein
LIALLSTPGKLETRLDVSSDARVSNRDAQVHHPSGNGSFVGKQLAEVLHPSDIAVLIPAIPNKLKPIFRFKVSS